MKLFLYEITENEKQLIFTETHSWVNQAVLSLDEEKLDSNSPRSIQLQFNHHQINNIFIIAGKITTYIQLLCSRCTNLFQKTVQFQFTTLFSKDPIMAGVAHFSEKTFQNKSTPQETRLVGQNQGFARHAHANEEEELPNHTPIDIIYLREDFIDLQLLLLEQLQLQIPLQPLCQNSCQGICSQCGNDLNQKNCACHLKNTVLKPFTVLKDFKVNK